ncbi:MAG: flagellar export chaperone FliS [Deltaproteobacteria bacterium]|nr:flagellar export chaperone FliS [Deltaproteobacteria bacterium]
MNDIYSTYKKNDISTSSPLKMVLMLYDGAITFLKKAVEFAEQGDIKNKNIYANKARDIIVEFNNSLNIQQGGEIAAKLRSLYFFMDRHLMISKWDNDIQGLNDVIDLLSNLREGWQDVYEQKMEIEAEYNANEYQAANIVA